MSEPSEPRPSWIYEGVWGMLTGLLSVPRDPPRLPAMAQERTVARKPSPGFVRYLKFQFWVAFTATLFLVFVGSLITVLATENGWVLLGTVVITVPIVLLGAIGYLAIHLRYDTTWYVFSDRSMRLRRGIWRILESTITFENVQNVKVTQGPLQRYFGIANVVVETAGGGGAQSEPGSGVGMHVGLIEGVAEAAEIRDSIMGHAQASTSSGLGDEPANSAQGRWSPRHIDVLREIRDLTRDAAAVEK